jgi:hypothetical protein
MDKDGAEFFIRHDKVLNINLILRNGTIIITDGNFDLIYLDLIILKISY